MYEYSNYMDIDVYPTLNFNEIGDHLGPEKKKKFDLANFNYNMYIRSQKKFEVLKVQVEKLPETAEFEEADKLMSELNEVEAKSQSYRVFAERYLAEVNETIVSVAPLSPCTRLRQQLKKEFPEVKVSNVRIDKLSWLSEETKEAPHTTVEKALEHFENTIKGYLNCGENDFNKFYSVFVGTAFDEFQAEWYNENFTEKQKVQMTWQEFMAAFVDQFAPSSVICQDLENTLELYHMRMIPQIESFPQYCNRFRTAFKKVKDITVLDNHALGHLFVESLPVMLQDRVYTSLLQNGQQMDEVEEVSKRRQETKTEKLIRQKLLFKNLNVAMVETNKSFLLLNRSRDSGSSDIMKVTPAPPFSPKIIKDLGLEHTVGSKQPEVAIGIAIRGRAQAVVGQKWNGVSGVYGSVDYRNQEGRVLPHISDRTDSKGYVEAATRKNPDEFRKRQWDSEDKKEGSSEKRRPFVPYENYCKHCPNIFTHATKNCQKAGIVERKSEPMMCGKNCGQVYVKGHNEVCPRKSARVNVAAMRVQKQQEAKRTVILDTAQNADRTNSGLGLLPQEDIDLKVTRDLSTNGSKFSHKKGKTSVHLDSERVQSPEALEYSRLAKVNADLINKNRDRGNNVSSSRFDENSEMDVVQDTFGHMEANSVRSPTDEEIDYELRKTSYLCKSNQSGYKKIGVNASSVELVTNSKYYNVPVTLENNRIFATVDTGASASVLSPRIIKLLSLPITKVVGSINLAASDIHVPRIGTVNKVNFLHNGYQTVHDFEVMSVNEDLADCIIGTDLMDKVGLKLTGLATSWDTPTGPNKPDPIAVLEDEPNNSPYGSVEQQEYFEKELRPYLEANSNIPITSLCTVPESVIRLDTPKGATAYRRQYPVPEMMKNMLQEQVQTWLKDGVIKRAPINTSFNSPLTFAAKKDAHGNYTAKRPCLDPRSLNLLLPDDRFPIPLVRDVFQSMGKSKIFSTLDLRQAFHRFQIYEPHQHKTTFTVAGFQYCFVSCPFGLKSISSAFQRVMCIIFAECPFVTTFVDDVLVHSDTFEEHVVHVKECVRRLTAVNLILNSNKCHWAQKSVYLLGFSLSEKGVMLDKRKISNAMEWPTPKTGKDIQRFLGFANYFRDHIPRFSFMTARLDKLRNEGSLDRLWTREVQTDFDRIKSALCSTPVLSIPDMSHKFYVATDASAYSIGGVIYQIIDGEYRYIGFAARSLSTSQKNYSCTKRELLAVIFMLKKYHQYLWGNPFTLYTDHKALCYLQTQVIANPMMVGWLDIICDYSFDVVHLPGILNVIPDALSRLFEPASSNLTGASTSHTRGILSPQNTSTMGGSSSTGVREEVISNKPKQYVESMNAIATVEGDDYLTPPESERKKLLVEAHIFGHFGSSAMVTQLHNDGIHWKNIKQDAIEVIKECEQCLQFNLGNKAYRPLKSIMSNAPGDHWAIDLGTINVTSTEGSNYIMVLVDVFSRFCIARAIPNKTASAVAKEIIKVFCDFGFPKVLQSDNGTEFVNQILHHITEESGIDHRLTLPYNPRANGLAEKWVGTIKNALVKRLEENKADWELHLPAVQLAINCKYAALHGSRPFSIMFAREPNDFKDYRSVKSASHKPRSENSNAILKHIKDMSETIVPIIKARSEATQMAQQARFNSKHKIVTEDYPIGTAVMLQDPLRSSSSDPSYTGPFKIHGVTRNHNYTLIDKMNGVSKPYPIHRLKLAGGDPIVVEKDVNNVFEIQAIINHKIDPTKKNKYLYLVQWKGDTDPEGNTWEPVDSFNSKAPIKDYWSRRNGNKDKAKAKRHNESSVGTEVLREGRDSTQVNKRKRGAAETVSKRKRRSKL